MPAFYHFFYSAFSRSIASFGNAAAFRVPFVMRKPLCRCYMQPLTFTFNTHSSFIYIEHG